MSNEVEYDDNTTVKTLRERGDKAEARAKELEAQLKALQTEVRKGKVAPILKERGVPEGVARLLPDDVESTTEAVAKWLDDLGFKAPQAPAPQGEQPQTQQEAPVQGEPRPGIDPSVAATLSAIQRTEAGGQAESLVGAERKVRDIEALKGRGDLNFDKLVQMYNSGQLPF